MPTTVRKPRPGASFGDVFPHFVASWDTEGNEGLTPFDVTHSSTYRAWWTCDACSDHRWQATVTNRARGQGCPFCAGRRTCAHNSLEVLSPGIAAEWHPALNGELRPDDVTVQSSKKVWWRCPATCGDHVYQAPVATRSRGNGCPYCCGKKTCAHNSLAAQRPELAAQWHPTLNGDLTPENVTPSGGRTVWWKCTSGACDDHEWQAPLYSRASGIGCPFCCGRQPCAHTNLAVLFPDLVDASWCHELNGDLRPTQVLPSSDRLIWWKCDACCAEHRWQSNPTNRRRAGCPYCRGLRTCTHTSLATLRPDLAAEWHPTLNGDVTPNDVTLGTHYKAWWKCSANGHIWQANTASRVRGNGCSECTMANTSKQEIRLRWELATVLATSVRTGRVAGAASMHACDIVLEDERLVVEFDGWRWHDSELVRGRDIRKTEDLTAAGWRVVRLREAPLEPLFPGDVLVPRFPAPKTLADLVLTHLVRVLGLESRMPLDVYLAQDECLGAAKADREIMERTRVPASLVGPSDAVAEGGQMELFVA